MKRIRSPVCGTTDRRLDSNSLNAVGSTLGRSMRLMLLCLRKNKAVRTVKCDKLHQRSSTAAGCIWLLVAPAAPSGTREGAGGFDRNHGSRRSLFGLGSLEQIRSPPSVPLVWCAFLPPRHMYNGMKASFR